MKIYYDNSAEIIQRSNRYRKIRNVVGGILIFTVAVTIIGFIINIIVTACGAEFKALIKDIYTGNIVVMILGFLAATGMADSESSGSHQQIKIDSDHLCLVKRDSKDTLTIFPGEQTIYLDHYNYEHELYNVEQTIRFAFLYDYQPPRYQLTKWQRVLANLANFDVEREQVEYRACFKLKFIISPQSLTDEGRHVLMLDLDGIKSLKRSLSPWIIAGFTIQESGNLEIAQQFLDDNPYGFRQMHAELIEINHPTDYSLQTI